LSNSNNLNTKINKTNKSNSRQNKSLNNIVKQILQNEYSNKLSNKPKTKLLINITNKIKNKYKGLNTMNEQSFQSYVDSLKIYRKIMNLNKDKKILNLPIFYAIRQNPKSIIINDIFIRKGNQKSIKYEIFSNNINIILKKLKKFENDFSSLLENYKTETNINKRNIIKQNAKEMLEAHKDEIIKLDFIIDNLKKQKIIKQKNKIIMNISKITQLKNNIRINKQSYNNLSKQ
jgi:hypothetical protein